MKLARQTVTASELSAFRSCRQRWYLNYERRLDPIREESGVRALGTLYHDCVAIGIRAVYATNATGIRIVDPGRGLDFATGRAVELLEAQQPDAYAPEDEHADWRTLTDKLLSMLESYWEFMTPHWEHLVPMYVEEQFNVPVLNAGGRPGHLWLQGMWDVVWYDLRNGAIYVEDHKTTSKGFSEIERRLPLDVQMSSYVYGLKATLRRRAADPRQVQMWPEGGVGLGITAATIDAIGVVRYNVVRTKAPSKPKTNKDSTISTAAIDTKPATYAAALAAQVGTPTDKQHEKQQALLARLEETPPQYFAQLEHFWSDRELERWRTEVWVDAADMRAVARQPVRATRSQWFCTEGPYGCAYEDGCLEPESIPQFYQIREKRHRELSLAPKV